MAVSVREHALHHAHLRALAVASVEQDILHARIRAGGALTASPAEHDDEGTDDR